MRGTAAEKYLGTIYNLGFEGSVSTGDIAAELSIAPASVTNMLKKLTSDGLIDREKYGDVELTAAGLREVLRVVRKHRIVELFLQRILGYGLEQVHSEATLLSPSVPTDMVQRMAEVLGDPRFDPHGDPIPAVDGSLEETDSTSLAEVDPDLDVRVVRVPDRDAGLLEYLVEMGLVPGAMLSVAQRLEDEQLLRLRMGEDLHNIGLEAARRILVRPPKDGDEQHYCYPRWSAFS